ncbi:hypothetical protein DFH08DRAFT_724956, partial [Mycena albidolilacea]
VYVEQPGHFRHAASKPTVDAISDTRAQELAEYGIRSISVQASEVLNPINRRFASNVVDRYALAYGVVGFLSTHLAVNEPGNPIKGAKNIITLVTKEDRLPLRLALGDDAHPKLEKFYRERLAGLDANRELSTGMSFS